MLRTAVLAALLLACSLSPASAKRGHLGGGLHPDCNVTMPCEVPRRTQARREAPGRAAAPRALAHREVVLTHRRAALAYGAPSPSISYTGNSLVERARAYLGRTGPSLGLSATLWCAEFTNMVTGGGTGSRLAKSWLSHPRVAPQVGAIVVTARRGGGHVGIVSGFTASGDPIVISGNHGRKVGEGVYRRSRVLAFVSP